jgi:hypothetical protein
MKKVLLIGVVCVLFFAGKNAQAQSNAVKINFLSPIFSTANIAYERALSESSSFQLGFYYTGAKVSSLKYSGFGITPEYRFYLSDSPAPAGFYIAPYLRYQSVKLTEEEFDNEATFTSFGGGLIIGKQWVFKKRITFDIFLGPAYNAGKVKVDSGSEDEFDVSGGFDGFGLRTGMTLGVAF